MHTVKKEWLRPTMLDFNGWLKEKAEAQERMKAISFKGKNEDNGNMSVTKTKVSSKVFSLVKLPRVQKMINCPAPFVNVNLSFGDVNLSWKRPLRSLLRLLQ